MKNNKFLLLGSIFLTTSLFASEAYTPIAYGIKSLGMAGVGIANIREGAESGFENPALLSYNKNNELSVGVVRSRHLRKLNGGVSDPKNTYTPYVAISYKLNNDLGIGILTSEYQLQNSLTYDDYSYDINIKKRRAIIPISYKYNNFSLGMSLVAEKEKYVSNTSYDGEESYNSTDYGYMFGLGYSFEETGVMLAVNYKSKITHKFYNTAKEHYFYLNSASEIGVGLNWKIFNTNSSIEVDYKKIYSSKIYSKPWFENQNVFGIGYSYDTPIWSVRTGYKYVSHLYVNDYDALNVALPFESKSHYTVGATYHFDKHLSSDIAVLYAPYKRNIASGDETINTKDIATAISLNYSF